VAAHFFALYDETNQPAAINQSVVILAKPESPQLLFLPPPHHQEPALKT
jgi:hypothetical protein